MNKNLDHFYHDFQEQLHNHNSNRKLVLNQLSQLEFSQDNLLQELETYINTIYTKPYLVHFYQDSWYDIVDGQIEIFIKPRNEKTHTWQLASWFYLTDLEPIESFTTTITNLLQELDDRYCEFIKQ